MKKNHNITLENNYCNQCLVHKRLVSWFNEDCNTIYNKLKSHNFIYKEPGNFSNLKYFECTICNYYYYAINDFRNWFRLYMVQVCGELRTCNEYLMFKANE